MSTGARPSPRVLHEARVLEHLRVHGPASRARLMAATGLSRATISSLVAELLDRGDAVVRAAAEDQQRVGRPPETLALNPAAGVVLGVDFGHARVALVAADAAHDVVGSRSRSHPQGTDWSRRRRAALDTARELLAAAGALPRLVGVGIGVPGSIEHRAEVLAGVRDVFERELGVPVRCENNARLAGLAETVWGVARGVPDVAYLKVSSGVGGALVLRGRIVTGPHGLAGEFGHVCVDPAGPPCRCGSRGCLECYVRVEEVLRAASAGSVAGLRAALERGDDRALAVVRDAGRRIGSVLAATATVTDVTQVVLGGDLVALGEHLLEPVRQTLRTQLGGGRRAGVPVQPAGLGDYAGALGAVAQVLHDGTVPLGGAGWPGPDARPGPRGQR